MKTKSNISKPGTAPPHARGRLNPSPFRRLFGAPQARACSVSGHTVAMCWVARGATGGANVNDAIAVVWGHRTGGSVPDTDRHEKPGSQSLLAAGQLFSRPQLGDCARDFQCDEGNPCQSLRGDRHPSVALVVLGVPCEQILVNVLGGTSRGVRAKELRWPRFLFGKPKDERILVQEPFRDPHRSPR